MLNAQFNRKRINLLKDILLRLRYEESQEAVQADMEQFFKDVSIVNRVRINKWRLWYYDR